MCHWVTFSCGLFLSCAFSSSFIEEKGEKRTDKPVTPFPVPFVLGVVCSEINGTRLSRRGFKKS